MVLGNIQEERKLSEWWKAFPQFNEIGMMVIDILRP
jgi:hypothetical protein